MMDEPTRQLRLQIGNDLLRLMNELPKLLAQIEKAIKVASEAQVIDLTLMSKRIVDRFEKASEMAEAESSDRVFLEQLHSSIEGLREEIAQANLILNKLLP
jgi:hypothetical protein